MGLLALNEQFVPVVGLLVHFVKLVCVLNLHEFWNGSFLHDFLSALLDLLLGQFLELMSLKIKHLIVAISLAMFQMSSF